MTKPQADISAAVDMVAILARIPSEQRMETLALAVKIYIEAGNMWSPVAHLFELIERKANA